MPKRIAVYPGTFDPITNGHVDIIERALQLFDGVIVAVAESRGKKPWLPYSDRIQLAKQSLDGYRGVSVEGFNGLLTDFIKARGVSIVIRGLRAVSDFEYEFSLAGMNRKLMPEIETIYLMPADEYMFVSSSFVREVAQLGGDVSPFVPEQVLRSMVLKSDTLFEKEGRRT